MYNFFVKTELLSPAKNKEIAFVAINSGADAVYTGAYAFGARKNAGNSIEDIREIVDYAHLFGVKVYVTVNTILTDDELEEAFELVKTLDKIGVDAVIIQDFGLLKKIIDENLQIPLRMSTQCNNREIQKFEFFDKIGVSAVVAARELSLEQIKQVHEACPNLDLEFFAHGALCVSYSGQCYLSCLIGGRSANRGECAQPCRKKYSVVTASGKTVAKDVRALCLKDFNTSGLLEKMAKNGVKSFKIEGRLKDEKYVGNITAYYRRKLDEFSEKTSSGKCTHSFEPNPEKSFNRGFTTYFLEHREHCENLLSPKSRGEFVGTVKTVSGAYFTLNSNVKINPGDGLCFVKNSDYEGFLVNKSENGKIFPHKKVDIKPGTKVFRNLDVQFENSIKSKRQIGVTVKIGKTVEITDEDGYLVTSDVLNGDRPENPQKIKEIFVKQFSKTGNEHFYIKTIDVADVPFLKVAEINALRRDLFERLANLRIKSYKRQIPRKLGYAPYFKQSEDFRANVLNKSAKEFFEKCGCTVSEPAFEAKIPSRPVEVMRMKYCPKFALNMCKSPEKLFLVDEYGKRYPLLSDCKNCESVLMSK